jgi:hypothetical protein
MKKRLAFCCIAVLLTQSFIRGVEDPNSKTDATRILREVLGTWDCVLPGEAPAEYRHIKHLTPTHYTWVTYDREKSEIVAVSGGTWSYRDGKYQETCDFATDSHQHLRGKTYTFAITLDGDKWDLKVDGTEIQVDEVWNRMKPREIQTKNSDRPARNLLGSWERDLGPDAPKAARMIKHVTPTFWTWVIYDRDNKMVLAAMGGPWWLRGDKYVESVAFTTENVANARGQQNAFGFEVDGDRWLVKRGPEAAGVGDEEWKRVK